MAERRVVRRLARPWGLPAKEVSPEEGGFA